MRAVVVGACVATCAWGGVHLHARAQARGFGQWQGDAREALRLLTTPAGARATPSVRGGDASQVLALAQKHRIALREQGAVLRVPSDVLIELDGLGVLAIVAGPIVEGEATCMVLTDDGQSSFALAAMLDGAFAQAVRLR